MGDKVEQYGILVVQDFLMKRGYVSTAKARTEEAKQVRVCGV